MVSALVLVFVGVQVGLCAAGFCPCSEQCRGPGPTSESQCQDAAAQFGYTYYDHYPLSWTIPHGCSHYDGVYPENWGGYADGVYYNEGGLDFNANASTAELHVMYCSNGEASVNDDSCRYVNDGACDEPQYCDQGTDCSDCGNCPNISYQVTGSWAQLATFRGITFDVEIDFSKTISDGSSQTDTDKEDITRSIKAGVTILGASGSNTMSSTASSSLARQWGQTDESSTTQTVKCSQDYASGSMWQWQMEIHRTVNGEDDPNFEAKWKTTDFVCHEGGQSPQCGPGETVPETSTNGQCQPETFQLV